jgi:hypothetical protein
MPKFRVLQRSFINNAIAEENTIVEYDADKVGANLEPIDSAGAAVQVSGVDTSDIARQKIAAAAGDPNAVDTSAVASAAADAAAKVVASAQLAPAASNDLV